jgi:translocation and assembly module TamA
MGELVHSPGTLAFLLVGFHGGTSLANNGPQRTPKVKIAASLCLVGALALFLLQAIDVKARAAELGYKVEIMGVADDALRETLMAVSRLVAETARPPPTLEALKRRAEDDILRLTEALDSLGYYGANVGYDIDSSVSPVRVTLRIEPGEPYRLSGYDISGDNPGLANGTIRIAPDTIGLQPGMVAAAKPVVEGEQRLLAALAAQAYPLARVVDRKVVVDHAARSMTVNWQIDTGPYARFGDVTIEGLQSVDRDFLLARLPWEAGQPFDGGKVDAGRRALIDTRLFSSVKIGYANTLDADERLPMTVTVVEDKHRSIGGGLSYSTSDGPDGRAVWEHRNLFGAGERLTLTLEAGEVVQGLVADFRKPGLTDPRLAWLGKLEGVHENRETYDARTVGGSGGAEYKLTRLRYDRQSARSLPRHAAQFRRDALSFGRRFRCQFRRPPSFRFLLRFAREGA